MSPVRDQRRADLCVLLERLAPPDADLAALTDECNFFDAGVVDSLGMVHVIEHLESTYGVQFARIDYDPADLCSIGSILAFVERHRGA